MSASRGKMSLGLFIRPCGHHIAAWRHPRTQADAGVNFQHFIDMARTAERGLFDMLFSADTNSAWTTEGEGMYRQHYVAWIEPFTLLSALSGFTRNIGLVATQSTSFNEPYNIARKFASLDLVSGGRSGWNVVTSGNETEALNFNLDKHLDKADRYRRAREFVDVVTALWDSWDDDAFVRDREAGVFFDWNRMHVLNHAGEYFKVRGPLNVACSPQGRPVVIQAGASEDGKQLAAETAEVIFGASQSFDIARAFYADVKGRMVRIGRSPDECKILPGVTVTVANTEQEAKDRHEQYQELIHPDVGIGLLSRRMGYDLRGLPLDEPLPELSGNDGVTSRHGQMVELARRNNWTLRQLYQYFAGTRGHFSLIGSPSQIVDQMQEWFEGEGCDGFNVLVSSFPDDFELFVDLVVPELQRRGLFRTAYAGSTLRENLGLRRPESRFARARSEAAE